ncbi:helix-turn-helix domain-containing protein [Luteolibacter pohnpeiensis]|uniref:Helix-turn-helix domain-containing protein n=1 Tax=Luteolibacter pohnpeiensis TaxID=454153 RepID=A0A934VUV5_9BACT|nr:helix-turn-helix domain-containing protein [Luteolibacter pohnpeiensis]MBK1881153.1 helix-turn-helix domain-containing protein [Luteolibacter pohnpeiensis]
MLLVRDHVKCALAIPVRNLANCCFKDKIRAVDGDSYQIGRSLIEAREAAGLEVIDVMYQTKIPRAVVEALESEDFSFFSSPTYAKSFLRQYSEFLKVDADEWLNALEPGSYVAGQVLGPLVETVDEPELGETAAPATMGGFASIWLLLISGALVFGGVKGYQWLEQKLDHEPKVSTEPGQKEDTELKTQSTPPPEEIKAATSSSLPPIQPLTAENHHPLRQPAQPTESPVPRAIIVHE